MKLLPIAIVLVTLGLLTPPSSAGTQTFKEFKEINIVDETPQYFRDTEIQADLFFNQTFGPSTSGQTLNTGPGGGASLNVIFARYFGIGVKNIWFSNENQATYLLNGQLIARYPIESLHLAPYINVGGGAGFDSDTFGFGSLGGGIEYRVTPNVGTYVDTNWLFGAPNNAAILNTGLRLAF